MQLISNELFEWNAEEAGRRPEHRCSDRIILGRRNTARTRVATSGWVCWILGIQLIVGFESGGGAPPSRQALRQEYPSKGVVQGLAPDRRQARIRHEEIPGYMPRMTMNFEVRQPREMADVRVGDEIEFTLVVTKDDHWIEKVRKTGRREAVPASPDASHVPSKELKPGDAMPDFVFLGEDGKKGHLTDLRGRAVAFTFFFTRCPIPEFCPRMSRNFAAARELMLQETGGPTNWQFLSLSFDADFDRPAVLRGYATAYRGTNDTGWAFGAVDAPVLAGVAPALDLMVTKDAGGFSHNLRTVVLDCRGRIHRQFDGNEWTARQLADVLAEAARVAGP